MNIYYILLEMIEIRSFSGSLYRVLDALGSAVNGCRKTIADAEASGSFDYVDAIVADECDVVDNLIGAAFVTCQAEINAVVSNTMRIHTNAQPNHILTASDGTKAGIMALGSPLVAASGYTQIQVINAFANYFKHNDEWDAEWDALTGQQKQTADIISSMGAKQYSTGNLRGGAMALGIPEFEKIEILSKYVQQWAINVKKTYIAELKNLDLL